MAKSRLTRPTLPDKDSALYMPALVAACIEAFSKFGDDSMALNYMGVEDKLRPMVIENKEYKRATRQLQAEKFLEEIEEIEQISAELKDSSPDEGQYDIRNPKDAANYTKDIKETLSLRLKVADMRRDILSISKNKEVEENDALNIFFIALTAEEFAAMENTEIHDGTESAKIDDAAKAAAPNAKKKYGADVDDEPDPFIIAADGSVEEILSL